MAPHGAGQEPGDAALVVEDGLQADAVLAEGSPAGLEKRAVEEVLDLPAVAASVAKGALEVDHGIKKTGRAGPFRSVRRVVESFGFGQGTGCARRGGVPTSVNRFFDDGKTAVSAGARKIAARAARAAGREGRIPGTSSPRPVLSIGSAMSTDMVAAEKS